MVKKTISAVQTSFKKLSKLLNFLLAPHSHDPDVARREFILNVLLLGAIFLAFFATAKTTVTTFFIASPAGYTPTSPIIIGIIFLILLFCYRLSRRGAVQWVIYGLLGTYVVGATYTVFVWGIETPQALLVYALTIVITGILVDTRFAFLITTIIIGIMITIGYLQFTGLLPVNNAWRNRLPDLTDAISYSVTLFLIALVSWLSNREIEKLLKRARNSESALRKERDMLESKVQKRTEELKRAQLEKVTQLYHFAEFGRLSSGLFHNLVEPLTLVSLNLNGIKTHSKARHKQQLTNTDILVKRAILGTRRLEEFIQAARKQFQNQEITKLFELRKEIKEVVKILEYKAQEAHILIQISAPKPVSLYGNPSKFNQLMTNLISNAIDAYQQSHAKNKKSLVLISLSRNGQKVTITVRDWGIGISEEHLPKIFEPLFTTKHSENNMGMGLFISRDIVEKSFHGSMQLESTVGKGTTFFIQFPRRTRLYHAR